MDLYDTIEQRARTLANDNLPSFQSRIRAGDDQHLIDAHFLEIIRAAMNIGALAVFEQGVPLLPVEVPPREKV